MIRILIGALTSASVCLLVAMPTAPARANSQLVAGQWSLSAACSWGSATYVMTISPSGGTGFSGSMNGIAYSGSVNGKGIVFTGTVAINNVRYQGSVRSPTSMGGTFTQTLAGETCTWSANRIGAPPQQIALAKPKEAKAPKAAAPPTSKTANAQMSPDWTRCVNEKKSFSLDVAIDACTRIIDGQRETPQNVSIAHTNRGSAHYDKKEFERAITDYDRAIAIDSRNASAYVNRGATHERKGNLDSALADYNRAIDLDPRHVNAYNGRGNIRALKREWDRAIADYDKQIDIDLNRPGFVGGSNS
jgi:hypothetical protein